MVQPRKCRPVQILTENMFGMNVVHAVVRPFITIAANA